MFDKGIKSFYFFDIVLMNKLWLYLEFLISVGKLGRVSEILKSIDVDYSFTNRVPGTVCNELNILTAYREKDPVDIQYHIPQSFIKGDLYTKILNSPKYKSKIFNVVFGNNHINRDIIYTICKDELERTVLQSNPCIKPDNIITKDNFFNVHFDSILGDIKTLLEITVHDCDMITLLVNKLKEYGKRSLNLSINVILTNNSDISVIKTLTDIRTVNIIDMRL